MERMGANCFEISFLMDIIDRLPDHFNKEQMVAIDNRLQHHIQEMRG
mgnify:CR=1 FL=1